ncbi:DUF84 family protein [Endozoicomonas sp. SCSIO W0465]|uniref:DUF84 family protein n=1 Tax=Endozoicomonas sp. SCSIO W0465 TaxID=2918516 RepID=UPI002075554A|nr:DUF84 family protein [Endozoicomonas sp. SCSIO W0465]USE34012.1 inosine/xanthosine triphosphatase [Endozoicomonas sp. SCSIO W0465]
MISSNAGYQGSSPAGGLQGFFPASGHQTVYTSQNPQKIKAGEEILTSIFGPAMLVAIKPSIRHIPTQPVGEDIRKGAESRINEVKAILAKPKLAECMPVEHEQILVSFENGLRVDTQSENKEVTDVACACIEIRDQRYRGESIPVPVQVNGVRVGMVTDEILDLLGNDLAGYDFTTGYEHLTPEQQRVFNLMIYGHEDGTDDNDAIAIPQVAGFRQRVIETLKKKGVADYWEAYSNGNRSRHQGLVQALKSAINQFINSQRGEDKLRLAQTFQQRLISQGLPASLGGRYGQTVWMRDFGIMINTLNEKDIACPESFSSLLNSLTTIANHQCASGLIPQVVIPEPLLGEFVYLRMLGGDNGSGWYTQLQKFLQANYPEAVNQLPHLSATDVKTLALPELKKRVDGLKTIYREISEKARNDGLTLPQPSHTLKGFLTDTLATLTPGTTDSEIHFIRSFTKLLDLATSDAQIDQVRALIPSLASAMTYLDQHVLDPETSLPQGSDNRDMLDTFLLQKLLCSNACFLYQGFSGLVRHYDKIGPELASGLKKHFPAGHEPTSGIISALMNDQPLRQPIDQLRQQIKKTFIYPKGVFAPLDFVNSDHKVKHQPIAPEDYIPALVAQNTAFLQGKEVNLQGLALAIELGLVDQEDHPAVVDLIRSQLTPAGLKAFSPINMASDYEIVLLQQSRGFLVWPQIECRVADVLKKFMDKTKANRDLLMALEAIGKQRPGFREWYNTTGQGEIYPGGAENQSWHITNLVYASRSLP